MVVSSGAHLELRNCQACHAKPDNDQWKKSPSTAACVSCHNNVDLATGQGHKPGAAAEGSCAGCHPPEGAEFGPSVAGAHTYPGFSTQLPGVVLDIVKIDGGRPGESPSVTFTVKNKKGEPIEAAKMANLRLVLAWPTTDYKVAVEEDVRKAQPLGGGSYSYKFRYVLPSDAGGSGAVAIQGFMPVDLKKPNGDVIKAVNDVGFNAVKYFPITDAQAQPRRQLVKRENCNGCHMSLATHGEARRNCRKCHVPGANEPPLPAGVLPTLLPQADGSVKAIQPIASACVGCHTKAAAQAHMDTMTSRNGEEACITCHGVGRAFAVETVHRR